MLLPKLVFITIASSTSEIAEPPFETNEQRTKTALTEEPSGANRGLADAIVKFVKPAFKGYV